MPGTARGLSGCLACSAASVTAKTVGRSARLSVARYTLQRYGMHSWQHEGRSALLVAVCDAVSGIVLLGVEQTIRAIRAVMPPIPTTPHLIL